MAINLSNNNYAITNHICSDGCSVNLRECGVVVFSKDPPNPLEEKTMHALARIRNEMNNDFFISGRIFTISSTLE